MEKTTNDYSFNFFRPPSDYSRRNRNIIITTILVWFISIFGFQILLLILQKPTPEKSLVTFETVVGDVRNQAASTTEKQEFIASLLHVAGKSSVKKADRVILDKSISWAVYSQLSDTQKVELSSLVAGLRASREKLTKASEEEYTSLQENLVTTKAAIIHLTQAATGGEPGNHMEAILPYSLNTEGSELTADDVTTI